MRGGGARFGADSDGATVDGGGADGLVHGLYPVAHWILPLVCRARLAEAYAILPYAFLSLWINIAGSILLAGLAGHELITHRNYVVMAGSAFYLTLAFCCAALQPAWVGLCADGADGRLFRSVDFAAAGDSATSFLPHRWDRRLFREMCGYGLHFQLLPRAKRCASR